MTLREAVKSLDAEGADALRHQLERERRWLAGPPASPSPFWDLHRCIARLAGNAAWELFVDVLNSVQTARVTSAQATALFDAASLAAPPAKLSSATHAAHVGIVEAIVEGDLEMAGIRMTSHLWSMMELTE